MASTFTHFPQQDLPEKDKNDAWLREHLHYAESLLKNYSTTKQRMTRFFQGYNGIKQPGSMEWLTKTYGQENKAKFITYRLGKTKIDLLHGEWLKRPLAATVTTVNSESVNNKMHQQDFIRGAMVLRDEIGAVKKHTGVDVMEGIPIPADQTEFEKMSFKDKCEDIAQIICDNQIISLDVKKKLGDGFKNVTITNFFYRQVERNEKGEIEFHNIDPRDAIFEAVEGDDYMEKSPVMGCRKVMSIHQVLTRYDLTKEQRKELESARLSPDAYIGTSGISRGHMTMNNSGELVCDVIHIVWKSVRPIYTKVVPKTESQLMLDNTETELSFEMDAVKYETNKEFHDANVAKGLYKVVTKYIEDEYEATRIGGCIDVNMRRTFFQKRSVDAPSKILNSTYGGYIHGRVDGVTVSLQQVIENFDTLYDIIKYQQSREIAKSKGKVLTIDKAGLGVKQDLKDTYFRMANDQVLEYDSSASGNIGNRNLDPATMFKEIDMGLSDSFQSLLMVEQSIIQTLNQLTGINENRMGVTAASSTATAQQSDIANSRTITEALFYGYSGAVKRAIKDIVDASALSWAYFKTGQAEQILGSEKFSFLQATIDLAYRDYGVSIEDGTKHLEIAQSIDNAMQIALNAKELHALDYMNVQLANTLAEKKRFLKSALDRSMQIAQEQMASDQQIQAQMQQQALATQVQIAQENREDAQLNEKENIQLQGQVDIEVNRAKQEGDLMLLGHKIQGEIIANPPQPSKP